MLEIKNIAVDVLNKAIFGIESVKEVLDTSFQQAIIAIENVQGRVVVTGIGKSGIIARKIAATFASTGTPSVYVNALEASHGDLGMITEKDMVIVLSNSGESKDINFILDYCHRFAIPIIGITRNPASTIAKASNIAINLPKAPEASEINAPTTSTTMMLALGDAMAVTLYTRRGFTESDFQTFHPGGSIGAQLLKVSDLMHTDSRVPLINKNSSTIDGILEMAKKRLGCVGVIDENNALIGIFTSGDLARSVDKDFKNSSIFDMMKHSPIVIEKSMLASEALGLMNKCQITVLFVVENNQAVGIIHMHDILKAKIA